MVEKFGIEGAKEALLGRSKPRLSNRALMLTHPIQSQQLLKIDAGKFRATINHNGGREPSISLHSEPECHHAGAVTRFVKGQVGGGNPPRMGEDEQGEPALAQQLTGS